MQSFGSEISGKTPLGWHYLIPGYQNTRKCKWFIWLTIFRMEGSCEQRKEISNFTNNGEFVDLLTGNYSLRKNCYIVFLCYLVQPVRWVQGITTNSTKHSLSAVTFRYYEITRFITLFIKVAPFSTMSERIQTTPSHTVSLILILILSFHLYMVSFFDGFWVQCSINLSFPLRILRAPSILSFFIWSSE
jgi:hypothetical protein